VWVSAKHGIMREDSVDPVSLVLDPFDNTLGLHQIGGMGGDLLIPFERLRTH